MKTFSKTFILVLFLGVMTIAPCILFAQPANYTPLSPLPDLSTPGQPIQGNFSSYITGIYRLAIAVAGALAVIVIVYEGIIHMTSESFTGKSDAKGRIQAAVGGLLLALLAFLILKTINPTLVNFNVNIPPVTGTGNITPPQPPGSNPPPSPLPQGCQYNTTTSSDPSLCPPTPTGFTVPAVARGPGRCGNVTLTQASEFCCVYYPMGGGVSCLINGNTLP